MRPRRPPSTSLGWDRLWRPLGLAVLVGLRDTLRRENLFGPPAEVALNPQPLPPAPPDHRTTRTIDGTYNDPVHPRTGMAGSRFGRNIPLAAARRPSEVDVLEPSPREISRALMTRRDDTMIEAEGVNALVAAWLQFMIRDWFSHGPSAKEDPWEIQLFSGDPWPRPTVTVLRTTADPTRPADAPDTPPTSVNTCTHWWDASQIYGTTPEYQRAVRTMQDGKLKVNADGTLPVPQGEGGPTTEPGFWVGLLLLHTLFTLEHNAVCDMLRGAYPHWGDEEIFQRARLVVAALIAKIHTVEWTPSVISHPTTTLAMRANWFGLQGEHLNRVFGRLTGSEVVSGIPGSEWNDYGVPYSLTEEFTAVYRMHPLVPDYFDLRSLTTAPGRCATCRGRAGSTSWRRCRCPTCCTRSARGSPASSRCTTFRGSSRSSSGPTMASRWTWPRPTSCGTASSGSRGTATSAGCCTCGRRRRTRS